MSDRNGTKACDLWRGVMEEMPNATLTVQPYFAHQMLNTPRHLVITLARYKFAARLIGDKPRLKVLELGCNEGVGTLHLAEVAREVTAVDFDERAIRWAGQNLRKNGLKFICDDFIGKKYGLFNAVISLDVIEHIPRKSEGQFLGTITRNLSNDGFCVVGTPNITASRYASKFSRKGHVNLFDAARLKSLFLKKFRNVFVFGMNDELVHTGFYPMAHYLILLGCNKK